MFLLLIVGLTITWMISAVISAERGSFLSQSSQATWSTS